MISKVKYVDNFKMMSKMQKHEKTTMYTNVADFYLNKRE